MNTRKDKDTLFNMTARFVKYNLRVVVVIVFFIGLISMAVFGNKGILQRIKLEAERKELEEQLKTEVRKTRDLQKEIEELKSSDQKLEEIAREKFGMTAEGEEIYRITVDSTK